MSIVLCFLILTSFFKDNFEISASVAANYCHNAVFQNLKDIPCHCNSSYIRLKLKDDEYLEHNRRSLFVKINGCDGIYLRLGQDGLNKKYIFRDEDFVSLNINLLTTDDTNVLDELTNAGSLSPAIEMFYETDLTLVLHSQKSYNPSYIYFRKFVRNKWQEYRLSLPDTLDESESVIHRIKIFPENDNVSGKSMISLKCDKMMNGDTADSFFNTSPCNLEKLVHTLPDAHSLYSANQKDDIFKGTVTNPLVITRINLNPRGEDAQVWQNRWRYNRYSLTLSKYFIYVKIKDCPSSLNALPFESTVAYKPIPNKRSSTHPNPTHIVQNMIMATAKPENKTTGNNNNRCGKIFITEKDKELYFLKTTAQSPNDRNLPEARSAFGSDWAAETYVTSPNIRNKDTSQDLNSIYSDESLNWSNMYDPNDDLSQNLSPSQLFNYIWNEEPPHIPNWDNAGNDGNNAQEGLPDERIMGGTESVPGAWPWQVSIRVNGRHGCGGSLLTDQWVISAQHCFQKNDFDAKVNLDLSKFTVHLGSIRLGVKDETEQIKQISKIIFHPEYSKSKKYNNDIALLKLEKAVKFNKYVSPICIAPKTYKHSKNSVCYVTGFGETYGYGRNKVLNELLLPVIDHQICNQGDWLNNRLTVNMFCAGGTLNKDACVGDSGGPFTCFDENDKRWKLVGIVSWGIQCGKAKRPGVYTKVKNYYDWITKHITK